MTNKSNKNTIPQPRTRKPKQAAPDELASLLASLRVIGRENHESYGVPPEPLVVAWLVRAWLAEAAGEAVPNRTPDVEAAFERGDNPPRGDGTINLAFGYWLSGCIRRADGLLAGPRRKETIAALQAMAVEFPLAEQTEPASAERDPEGEIIDTFAKWEDWLIAFLDEFPKQKARARSLAKALLRHTEGDA